MSAGVGPNSSGSLDHIRHPNCCSTSLDALPMVKLKVTANKMEKRIAQLLQKH